MSNRIIAKAKAQLATRVIVPAASKPKVRMSDRDRIILALSFLESLERPSGFSEDAIRMLDLHLESPNQIML